MALSHAAQLTTGVALSQLSPAGFAMVADNVRNNLQALNHPQLCTWLSLLPEENRTRHIRDNSLPEGAIWFSSQSGLMHRLRTQSLNDSAGCHLTRDSNWPDGLQKDTPAKQQRRSTRVNPIGFSYKAERNVSTRIHVSCTKKVKILLL